MINKRFDFYQGNILVSSSNSQLGKKELALKNFLSTFLYYIQHQITMMSSTDQDLFLEPDHYYHQQIKFLMNFLTLKSRTREQAICQYCL